MPCKGIYGGKGRMVGIACSMVSRRKVCHVCGAPMTRLCDASNDDGTPCDMPMCNKHSHRIGKDTDVCEKHFTRVDAKQAMKNRKGE